MVLSTQGCIQKTQDGAISVVLFAQYIHCDQKFKHHKSLLNNKFLKLVINLLTFLQRVFVKYFGDNILEEHQISVFTNISAKISTINPALLLMQYILLQCYS